MHVTEDQLLAALGEWRRPGLPLIAAIAAALRDAVLDGRLRTGSRLPAERRVAESLGVSRGTVTAALAVLREEGWLDTRQGSASTLRLPPTAVERIAPLSATGDTGSIDLRRAVPAAPHSAYVDAMARAAHRSDPVLAQDGDPGPGLPELRTLVARRYTQEGLPTRPEQILVTGGARAALALLCAHLRPRVAAVEIPSYFDALALMRSSGIRLAGCQVTTAGWDPDQLEQAFRSARGGFAYLVPDFHNPTGALMGQAARRRVAELAAEHAVTVIADETMRDLDLRDNPEPLPRIRDALLIGSGSKTVWGGLRVGWVRGPAGFIAELSRHPLAMPMAAAPIQQLVAVELLRDPAPLLCHRRRELRIQRDHLAAALAGDDRWRFTVPHGGLALWLRLTSARADDLAARAHRAGLELTPGPRFAADATLLRHIRIPFTPPVAALDRIAKILDEACTP
ncbi:aminotransferase-like domain-containing protein [Yinghuangia soli]|uniref:PLP-dependent aminotransferase family protein n=1 Tax=Yinghuangia soli TaxID=2908204 RepID=A0AA41Q3I3_9ACTN|nr:PLP-dependent aminotransferase family protein [Yinghuangia soli]MCF2530315.1 PLP-dependent aminotransferase family protein [Yinghuangia soli]